MWLSRREYQRLLDDLTDARKRVQQAEESLALERHENRVAERHWADSLLRAKQSYPLQKEQPVKSPAPQLEPVIDLGELEALTEAARNMGFENPRTEAERILRSEKGLPLAN